MGVKKFMLKKILCFFGPLDLSLLDWSKNGTGANRTGQPRPSIRGPFRGHLRGMFRGESSKG